MDTATNRVVRTVTIIGTLLGGLGVFGATKPSVSGPARWITIAAVACAALAVACALAAQILTITRHLNPENLAAVRAWYKRRHRHARLSDPGRHGPAADRRGAGRGGGDRGAGHRHAQPADDRGDPRARPRPGRHPRHRFSGPGAPPTSTITAEVTFPGLTSGQSATMVISAARTGQVLASAAITPATNGTATRTLTVSGLGPALPVTGAGARGGWPSNAGPPWAPARARPAITCTPTSP